MPTMPAESSPPPDVCLLLRAHAEQRWLSREVIPVLRQVEARDDLPEEQYGAALAYLEVIWMEAQQRAQETDGAREALKKGAGNDSVLPQRAFRYYAAVRNLRNVVSRRVGVMLRGSADLSKQAPAQF